MKCLPDDVTLRHVETIAITLLKSHMQTTTDRAFRVSNLTKDCMFNSSGLQA